MVDEIDNVIHINVVLTSGKQRDLICIFNLLPTLIQRQHNFARSSFNPSIDLRIERSRQIKISFKIGTPDLYTDLFIFYRF